MDVSRAKLFPVLIALAVLTLCVVARVFPDAPGFDLIERLELMTYDWRVKLALPYAGDGAVNQIGVVLVDEESLRELNKSDTRYFWPFPRKLHGHLVQELTAQGAEAITFDIGFFELHPNYAETREVIPGQGEVSSDEAFGWHMAQAGNVFLAVDFTVRPNLLASLPAPFQINAAGLGHTKRTSEIDTVARRVPLFHDDPVQGRRWTLGMLAAARHLKLDLTNAIVERNRVTLHGPGGIERVIPTDSAHNMLVNWSLPLTTPKLLDNTASFHTLIEQRELRRKGQTFVPTSENVVWTGKLVFIGGAAVGNNVTDKGPTPLSDGNPWRSMLAATHWNVANSILTGRFVHPRSLALDLGLMALLTGAVLLLNRRCRIGLATAGVVGMAVGFTMFSVWIYVQHRQWLSLVLPVGGTLLLMQVCLATHRVLVEERARRSLRRFVSPNILDLVLRGETIPLEGARKPLTVFFADLRGFTSYTDQGHAQTEAIATRERFEDDARRHALDVAARETMSTVNLYLAAVVEAVKDHDGTLDKYIGDCVMAFWGAPTDDDHHALSAVRAAIAAQRAIEQINTARQAENERRQRENDARAARGEPPLPPLALLKFGIGINTGTATAGFMGPDAHISNYTVFGREVNIASRLEQLSEGGRITISAATFDALRLDDPELAVRCRDCGRVEVRGITEPIHTYDVPWQPAKPELSPSPEVVLQPATPKSAAG